MATSAHLAWISLTCSGVGCLLGKLHCSSMFLVAVFFMSASWSRGVFILALFPLTSRKFSCSASNVKCLYNWENADMHLVDVLGLDETAVLAVYTFQQLL